MDIVAVTYGCDEMAQRTYRERLEDVAMVVFVAGAPDAEREQTLRRARVLVAGNVGRELTPDEMQRLDNVELIQVLSAGADTIPFADISPSITIASNVGAYSEPIAEHVLAMVLALAKHLVNGDLMLKDGIFDRSDESRMVAGMTAGVIGFGGIGQATARLLRRVGVRILAVNRRGKTDEPVDEIGTLADLDRILSVSDLVVLALPLTRETRGLIDERRLGLMKRDAILINVARGPLIDEEALYRHAEANPAFQVGLDVWWDEPFAEGKFHTRFPILDLPNVLGSPHNSGDVPGIMGYAAQRAAENVRAFLAGKEPRGIVRRDEYSTS